METMTSEQFRRMANQKRFGKKTTRLEPQLSNEDDLQIATADYLRKHYPDVPFDGNSKNVKLEVWQGAQMKRMGKAKSWPDMFIARARHGYHGLYLELKREGESVRRKDNGELLKNEHLQAQAEMHEKLRAEGYWCDFVIGFGEAKRVLDWYLGE